MIEVAKKKTVNHIVPNFELAFMVLYTFTRLTNIQYITLKLLISHIIITAYVSFQGSISEITWLQLSHISEAKDPSKISSWNRKWNFFINNNKKAFFKTLKQVIWACHSENPGKQYYKKAFHKWIYFSPRSLNNLLSEKMNESLRIINSKISKIITKL